MLGEYLEAVKEKGPLVHSITNYVTVNDVANMVLACGASPIMSDEPEDVEDITSICQALNINIGTLNKQSIKAMHLAGAKAKKLSHPIVLDPVGAGASKLRTDTAVKLIKELKPDVIRGNVSEIKAIATGVSGTKGVDANAADAVTQGNLSDMIAFVKAFSKETGSIVAMTGAIDLVANSSTCYVIYNGAPQMSSITGTGCQLDGLIAAFIAANPDNKLQATAAAVIIMGLAGENGLALLREGEGNASYRNYIIDSVYNMEDSRLENGAKYEVR